MSIRKRGNNWQYDLYDSNVKRHRGLVKNKGIPSWRKSWLTALRSSGIKKCTFYDLRHSFVSNLIVNEGVDFETVMSLSGHKTLSMLKRYTHTNRKVKKEAVRTLEKYVNLVIDGHNLVTKSKIEESEKSKIVNLTS